LVAAGHGDFNENADFALTRYVGLQPAPDADGDGISDADDNCPVSNPDQSDRDGDRLGDLCDAFPDDPDNEQAQCEAELAECREAPGADADGDGESDATDRCPSTATGEAVDGDGCSLGQFCTGIALVGRDGPRRCKRADWRNDESLMQRADADCRVAKGARGDADDRCVVAVR
jgi:hypothetical protein